MPDGGWRDSQAGGQGTMERHDRRKQLGLEKLWEAGSQWGYFLVQGRGDQSPYRWWPAGREETSAGARRRPWWLTALCG